MKTPRNSKNLIRLSAALLLAGLLTAATADEAPKEGTFEGDWAITGTVQEVEVGGEKVILARLEGPVTLRAHGGLAREFDAVCNSVRDQKTGGVARCTWTDDAGDVLLLEVSGSILGPMGTSREAKGTVVGGTGRYAGIEGGFELDWLFVDSALDDTRFKGYVTKLNGSWKRP